MDERGGVAVRAIPCERCGLAPSRFVAIDLPEQEGGLMFGDQVAGRLLCGPCLTVTEADGPWDAVEALDAA